MAPITVNYEPVKKKCHEWVQDAIEHFMANYAGKNLSIGDTGYTLHIPESKQRAKKATYNVTSQKQSEAFKKLDEVIAGARHLASSPSADKTKKMEGCTGTSPVDALAAPSGGVLPPQPPKVNTTPQEKNMNAPKIQLAAGILFLAACYLLVNIGADSGKTAMIGLCCFWLFAFALGSTAIAAATKCSRSGSFHTNIWLVLSLDPWPIVHTAVHGAVTHAAAPAEGPCWCAAFIIGTISAGITGTACGLAWRDLNL